MSTKRDRHHSLVHQLEDAVLALEARGETHEEIHSMVHMILRGFIRSGSLTDEYIQLATQAAAFRQQAQADADKPKIIIGS